MTKNHTAKELQTLSQGIKKELDVRLKHYEELLLETKNNLARENHSNVKPLLKELFKPLFEDNPGLESFGWRQDVHWNDEYYFWDTDFYYDSLTINGVEYYEDNWDDLTTEQQREHEKLAKQVEQFLKSYVPKDSLKYLIGLGANVMVYRDRIEIENFIPEHDEMPEKYQYY